MSNTLPPAVTRISKTCKERILETLETQLQDPAFEQKLAAMEKKDGSNSLGIQAVIQMYRDHTLHAFVEWNTHPNIGFRDFTPSENPPNEMVMQSLRKGVEGARKAAEAYFQGVLSPQVEEFQQQGMRLGRRFALGAIIGGASAATLTSDDQKRFANAFAYAFAGGLLLSSPELLKALRINDDLSKQVEKLRQNYKPATPDKVAHAACQVMDSLLAQERMR